MQYSHAVLLALASATAAQLSSQVPACAQSCLTTAIAASGCSPTDFACQCGSGKNAIANSATPCVLKSCTSSSDIIKVQQLASQKCASIPARDVDEAKAVVSETSTVTSTPLSTEAESIVSETSTVYSSSSSTETCIPTTVTMMVSSTPVVPIIDSVTSTVTSESATVVPVIDSVTSTVTSASVSATSIVTPAVATPLVPLIGGSAASNSPVTTSTVATSTVTSSTGGSSTASTSDSAQFTGAARKVQAGLGLAVGAAFAVIAL